MNGKRSRLVVLIAVLVCLASAVAFAQRGRRSRRPELNVQVQGNTPYDGRFAFVRLKYSAAFGRYGNWIGDGGVPVVARLP